MSDFYGNVNVQCIHAPLSTPFVSIFRLLCEVTLVQVDLLYCVHDGGGSVEKMGSFTQRQQPM